MNTRGQQTLTSDRHRRAFRIIVNHLCKLHLQNASFPGGMPLALTKERLAECLLPHQERYQWSPKADGTRAFLLFTALNRSTEPYQVLIDRAWNMSLVKMQIPLCLYDGTLLDGEWMPETQSFVAFDLIAVSGLSLVKTFSWNARRQLLANVLSLLTPISKEGMSCRLKPFYPLPALWSPTKDKQDIGVPCDGLIFTRTDMPTCFFRDPWTFKWKANAKQTVDLFIDYYQAPGVTHPVRLYAFHDRRPFLYRQQTEQETIQCPACFKEGRRCPPLAALVRHVVEFEPCLHFQGNNNILWHPVSIRSDKAHPNSLHVIKDTERILLGNGMSRNHLLEALQKHSKSQERLAQI